MLQTKNSLLIVHPGGLVIFWVVQEFLKNGVYDSLSDV